MIKVVDIFAGPGGLSEGFASITAKAGKPAFDVVLSVEKEEQAFETLRLRTFFRKFPKSPPKDYYRFLRGEIDRTTLFKAHTAEERLATAQCWHATLGPGGESPDQVSKKIDAAIDGDADWVLIGGPPCQAYSLAGRSRNQGNPEYDASADVRQRLYVEYLTILAEHRPAVFVMENVKGLLSATLANERVFHRILDDLRDPATAATRDGRSTKRIKKGGYRIYSLTESRLFENGDLDGSVIHAEKYGVPQARHRVILLGIRDDISGVTPKTLKPQEGVTVASVIASLPHLRSGISPKSKDSAEAWKECLRSQIDRRWVNAGTKKVDSKALSLAIRSKLEAVVKPTADRGGEFVKGEITCKYAPEWFCDDDIGGICNHSSRSHMETDLFRYFYAACFAKEYGKAPSLKNFPTDLLPDHDNVHEAIENGGQFSDRFRVQVASKPSTTIVSHISKDGHYYIHPDPLQCRSLTVREAARLQTFPDNYFFCGNRTAQYIQVGNAVPPLLAKQIGEIVLDVLEQAGANG